MKKHQFLFQKSLLKTKGMRQIAIFILIYTTLLHPITSQNYIANPGFEPLSEEYLKEFPPSDPSKIPNQRGCISCQQSWRTNHNNPSIGSQLMKLDPWNYQYESKVWLYGDELIKSPLYWLSGDDENNRASRLAKKIFGLSYAYLTINGFDPDGKNRPFNPKADYYQTKLIRPLKPGKKYEVSFYYRQNKYLCVNNMGILFTENPIQLDTVSFIAMHAQIAMEYIDTTEGMKLFMDTLEADKVYNYLTIGYFPSGRPIKSICNPNNISRDYKQIDLKEMNKHPGFAFMIDNVRIADLYTTDTLQNMLSSKINIRNIQFETNSSNLTYAAKTELDKLIRILQDIPYLRIKIEGHTDDEGDDEFNMKLSNKRVKTIINYLTNNGIAYNRLEAEGFGKKKPLLPNSNLSNKALNRRVEIKVLN
jgi:outer membrane protein OmpA-like peptidoglycan-associated protein